MTYADVIVDISHEKLDRSFQYSVPENLEQELHIGMVVQIPFGNSRHEIKGYVTGLSNEAKYDKDKIRPISSILSGEETTEAKLILLAAWMKEYYGSTMTQALKTVLPVREKVRARQKKCIVLAVDRDRAAEAAMEMEKTRCKARARLLNLLLKDGNLDFTEASKKYGITSQVTEPLVKQGYIRITADEVFRMPVDQSLIVPKEEPELTDEQKQAFSLIEEEWSEAARPVLVHGVTGSGKTQLYMKLIQKTVDEGKEVIVLIPEISLTYQTVRRFCGWFGDKVSILNSKMSAGERYDQFKRAKAGQIQIMVGPRSALFTPFTKLGLIIIDEEHEQSYKSENSPRYHARETAVHRAAMEGAYVVMGSATPSLEAYSRAQNGEYALVKLSRRYENRPLARVSVVDMREELKMGNRSILSRELADGIKKRLERGEQSVLFLNRRGYAGFVSCRSCGEVLKCPHCDVALTQHNNGRLVCHYCGYERPNVSECPVCHSPYIGGFKAGTQQVEQQLRREFPSARILRMDHDTTKAKGSYEKILSSFAEHQADILIGTQMIVKGHDFPDVTLVGAIAADMSLNMADYRCGERTFQLLTQAAGRAGRGRQTGEAVIQTYHPEHYSIAAAARQDYESFYQEEMSYRTLMDYPPAAHMLAVLAFGEDEALIDNAMLYLGRFVERIAKKHGASVIGPAEASIGRINDVYRRVLYLKHRDALALLKVKEKTEQYIAINSGFRKIYIQFDMT